jgi:hypothetical protein
MFAALLIGLFALLYYVKNTVSPPTPAACIAAGGQINFKPGGKFECKMPKKWWQF